MNLTKKKVLVIGVGRSGIASVRYLVNKGANVTVNDRRSPSECKKVFEALDGLSLQYELGGHDPSIVAGMDLVIASPGVPNDLPIIGRAKALGITIMSELELALTEINTPIVAVTGTNGKTTTTTLIGHLLESSGLKVCVAGNIGMPLLDVIETANQSDWVVLEVSSFQLETAPSLRPKIAVWLNASPDHLDRHASFEEYVSIKTSLFHKLLPGGVGIYNIEDATVAQELDKVTASLVPFSIKHSQELGGWCEEKSLVTKLDKIGTKVFSLQSVELAGEHNQENMLAAVLVAQHCGVNDEQILSGALTSFQGLRHRLEFVRELEGVRYYDDSKGTNVGATIGALKSFKQDVVLLAGGQSKGGDFAPLVPLVKDRVKQVILFGEAAEAIGAVLQPVAKTVLASSMEEAVSHARQVSAPGDVVLLSPACASLDMYRDYAERGEAFVAAISGLATQASS